MANLTETAYYTRKTIKFGFIFLIAFLLIRGIAIASVNYWKEKNPPPPPLPTVAFGKLPAIKFPDKGPNPPFTPRLETVDNKLPGFPEAINVYFIPQKTSDLFTWERAKSWAEQMGFINEPEKTDEYNFIYRLSSPYLTTLKTNVISSNFTYSVEYQDDLTLAGKKNAPEKTQAINEANKFLQTANAFTSSLEAGTQETIYFSFNPPKLEKAAALSEADFTLVNFFRGNINNLKVLPPNPEKSLVSILVSGAIEPAKKILEANYIHYPINEQTSATYPLKPVSLAWEELQKGQAYLADFGQNYDGQVVVRNVYLAYFDPPDDQRFLQPIYVFEGDREFSAYIPALDSKFIEENSPK